MDDSKLFGDATLGDLTSAIILTHSWGRERVFIADYFGKSSYISTEEYVTPYVHHLAQNVQKEFFEDVQKMRLTAAVNISQGASLSPIYEDIDLDIKKKFKGHKHAALCYEGTGGEKVLVTIDNNCDDDIVYNVYASSDQANLMADWFKFAREKNFYRGKRITAGCRFLDLKDASWDDVILPTKVKELLKSMVGRTLEQERILLKNGLSLQRGVLLSGKPGCGKTSAIKVIISEIPDRITVIYAQPSHMTCSADVRNVCQMAKDLSPCILIIEDIDWIAEDREHSGDPGKVIELMNQLSGIEEFSNVITIGTTNDVEKIEGAVKNRPGRFDRVITIDLPDEECRRKMISLFTKEWVISEDVDIDKLVEFTAGLSGAHMGDLCKTAAMKAIDVGSLNGEEIAVVGKEHFDIAMREVKDKDFSTAMKVAGRRRDAAGFNAEAPWDQ